MLKALKKFFCKSELKTFKVKVILPCTIVDDILSFDRKNETSYLVKAVDEVDAVQALIEKAFNPKAFSPCIHVCIDTIEEVEIVS